MAITQAGSTLQIGVGGNTSNTGTVSTTITVPADAEAVLVGIAAYPGNSGSYRGAGSMTFTKGGSQVAMTSAGTGGDSGASGDLWGAAIFYMALPDTGANKTLTWDWVGSGTAPDPVQNFSLTFWKGVDTASLVRSSDGAQANSFPITTPTLTCVSGDLIVAFCGWYTGAVDGSGSIDSWTNLTELTEIPHQDYSEGAWATGSPSGNTTVAAASGTNVSFFGGIMAVVLKPAAAGGTTTLTAAAGSYAVTGSAVTEHLVMPLGAAGE